MRMCAGRASMDALSDFVEQPLLPAPTRLFSLERLSIRSGPPSAPLSAAGSYTSAFCSPAATRYPPA
ncbi:hypothetical protein A6J33_010615 [Pantoea sp. FDAARGOS_194]|nr:hypothetical protein A6J33_010615 [Pantoea sp. FDAARGOS_194]